MNIEQVPAYLKLATAYGKVQAQELFWDTMQRVSQAKRLEAISNGTYAHYNRVYEYVANRHTKAFEKSQSLWMDLQNMAFPREQKEEA